MSSEPPVTVAAGGLGKHYLLWDNPRDRLRQPIRSRFAKWVGIPDKQYFREFWALRDVSFELHAGETLGVIGRNGCGKSTLLQLIAGTLTPTLGECSTVGRVSALLELGSGFNPEFSGKENVYMNAAVLGLSRAEVDARYGEIVDFADIGDFIDQPVSMYSSGMYVRLAFSVAINTEPDILVVDEALAVGDAFFVQKCMRFMRDFKQRGTLLFVSHDTDAVTALCDVAMLLEHGAMEAIGPARDVCNLYRKKYYGAFQDVSAAEDAAPPDAGEPLGPMPLSDQDLVDQRLKYLNVSQFRNDIELMPFDPGASSFGMGGGRIVAVDFLDGASGAPLSWVVGGERVTVRVSALCERRLERPIIGFMVKDRLGQVLFADNTYLAHLNGGRPAPVPGGLLVAEFEFRMPVLPLGEYFLDASIAEGTQAEHVQLHWLHEARALHSRSSSVCTGLVGVPMRRISLRAKAKETE
jgi:lipopolysaccharide transport system ATP-binding protein